MGILILSPSGDIRYANAQLCSMVRYPREALLAQRLADLISTAPARDALHECLVELRVAPQPDRRCDIAPQLRCRDGCEIDASIQLTSMQADAGLVVLAFVQDVTQQARQDYLLNAIATHDDLTGLPNRMQLPILLADQHSMSGRGALLLIDLDRFRRVNESFGHEMGDLLLVAVCARLRERLPDAAALVRFSGDVLVAMVGELDRTQAAMLAEALLAAMREPILINDWDYTQSLSLGIALFPTDGDEAGQLVRKADLALGWAKAKGGSAYAFYDGDVAERLERRHRLLGLLRKAVERDELRLNYQPRVDLSTGRITGWEALARWHNPSEGEISPAEFIPVAEESGLILEIGDWVLRQAIAQQGRWVRQGLASGTMAVNLSPRQMRAPDLAKRITSLLAEHGVAPDALELEITETALMEDVATAQRVLTELSRTGVKLAVDDFGTGYSSLAYLRSFPLNRLKIDRSFVRALGCDAHHESIARTIIVLAHSLDLSVVAEGVETEAQLSFLRANACEEMQGFLFSRALAVEDCESLLRENRCLSACLAECP